VGIGVEQAMIQCRIEKLIQGGEGFGRMEDGRSVMVRGALPGELIEANVTEERPTWLRAELVRVLEPSEERVSPACAHAARCGGCDLWHMDAARELGHKQRAAWEAVARLGKITLPEPTLFDAPSVEGWRVKMSFHVIGGRVGLYARASRRLVEIERCLVATPGLLEAARWLVGQCPGLERAELIAEAAGEGQVVLTLLADRWRAPAGWADQLRAALPTAPAVRGVRWQRGERGPDVCVGDATIALTSAHGWVPEPLRGERLAAGLFRQANPAMNAALLGYVREAVEWLGGGQVVELYGGSGNLTWGLAASAERVRMMEGESEGVREAQRLIAAGGLGEQISAEVVYLDGDALSAWFGRQEQAADVIVLDPPRVGAREVCEVLASYKEARGVVYVSCDAACLGRDLAVLAEGGWVPERAGCFDMFPRAAHCEVVVVLRRATV
jgi:23S rRNA (uracil1939-C5)-methyltransferase